MPELPEVEVVRRGLADHAVGRRIEHAEITGHRAAREHPGGAAGLADELSGQTLAGARRRGKFLWLPLRPEGAVGEPVSAGSSEGDEPEVAGDTALVVHLRMSGQLLVGEPSLAPPPHTHIRLSLSDGRELRFVDQRTFGFMTTDVLVPDPHAVAGERQRVIPASIAHIAPDPFEGAFDAQATSRRMRSRDVEIKRQLLEQTIVSGIGNIYADEALWSAGIHGRRRGTQLRQGAVEELLAAASDVMARSLDVGGTSFDALYVNVNGESGYFARGLDAYGRVGEPCRRCGTPLDKEIIGGRGSYFCSECQKPPRRRVARALPPR
ncbi:bifunctional DNA-formamidopyrimidine glycosylase/DNA-(apurinic or apyrimidinic site) lyase [Dietzia sp.]|uniref:bifunctional DNA-formamidopyrimidine glycosylase/DNA-(apurinic or apyrimidinic site) lyase n=1 Tax=Dietzia sp. TaxID=1871616 RepID=UPI002FDA3A05